MFEGILPHSFVLLCAAFQPCFTAPTYRTFQWLVAGWLHCPGRRTITAVAVASGAAGYTDHLGTAGHERRDFRLDYQPDGLVAQTVVFYYEGDARARDVPSGAVLRRQVVYEGAVT